MASYSQQLHIGGVSVEYVWMEHHIESYGGKPGIVLLEDSVYQTEAKKIITSAIHKISPETEPEITITYHRPRVFRALKFKPEVTKKQPAKQFVFLQMYDRLMFYKLNNDTTISHDIAVKYQLRSGTDSLLDSRTFNVKLLRKPVAPGQMQLNRLTALPQDYMNVIDSVISWCITEQASYNKELLVNSAATYDDSASFSPLSKKYIFKHSNDVVYVKGDGEFEMHNMEFTFKKTGKKDNLIGNSIGALFTDLTGLSSTKTKYFRFTDDNTFSDNQQLYHCLVTALQPFIAERTRGKNYDGSHSIDIGGYKCGVRFIKSSVPNFVITNGDTICTFYVTTRFTEYQNKKMWNGYDTSSIIDLPTGWNNARVRQWELTGNIGANAFCLESVNNGNLKKFFIDGKLTAVFYCNRLPAYATIHNKLNTQELKLLTMLSLISARYHQYN
jgi:hypothetical protein